MATEAVRGCGYRKVGGIYLMADGGAWQECDRLPYKLESCPVCGGGVHLSRAMTQIDPTKLFGEHDPCTDGGDYLCNPTQDTGYIMLIGEQFYKTPADFMRESHEQGVSRRIPFIPRDMKMGITPVYLAHKNAVKLEPKITESEPVPYNGYEGITIVTQTTEPQFALGIFGAFIPQRVEKLIWESEATPEVLEDLGKRGITPVIIPDGDKDHAPSTRRKPAPVRAPVEFSAQTDAEEDDADNVLEGGEE